MSWLSSFMHPGQGYKDAQQQQEQYYNQAQGYQQPYNQFGLEQGKTQTDYINALKDPQALYDKWSSGYQESDAAKQNAAMAQENGLNAASAMGLMGSNTALNATQAGTSQIVAADKQKYLDDLMKKYTEGAGLSQNMYNTGASTAGQMGNNAMNMGTSSAQNAYGQTNSGGNMFGGLLGLGGSVLGSVLGGPIGGAIGGALTNRWNTSGSR